MSEFTVTLLIPGYGQAAESGPNTTLLWQEGQKLMPWQAHLCHQLGLLDETGESLPAAQFSIDADSWDGVTVCAAPIHLRADRDTASLIPPQQLGLNSAEADELIASINEFLKRDEIELFRDTATDWFMKGLDGQNLMSFPPSFLAHRNVSTFLPGGEGGGHWRRLQTEIQMLLHTHPVNAARESRGKLPVNSLWFWGGATLPAHGLAVAPPAGAQATAPATTHEPSPEPSPGTTQTIHVYARDSFSTRLCAHLKVPCSSLDDFNPMADQMTSNAVLVDTSVIDAWLSGNETGALEAMAVVEREWIKPSIEQVKRSRIRELRIYSEDGQQALCSAASLETLARQHDAANPPWWKRVLARFYR